MASALDIYLVTLKGTLFAQETENVFAYELLSGGGSGAPLSAGLAAQFYISVVLPILQIVSVEMVFNEIYVENVDDPTDFFTDPISGAGVVTGSCEPPFVAWAFRLIRSTRLSRNGAKRIPGVPSVAIVDDAPDPSRLAALSDFADAYAGNVVFSSNTFAPIIYRKPSSVHPSGLGFLASGAEFVRLSTQNSRKIGRGR